MAKRFSLASHGQGDSEIAPPWVLGTRVRILDGINLLAHSIEGDFNPGSRAEVDALMRGSAS